MPKSGSTASMQQIVSRLQQQGYITAPPQPAASRGMARATDTGDVRFEITDKSLDFLGYRALRDLLGSLGKSSIGRHDTREMATGIEASGAPKAYEFGDTMNIDPGGHDPECGRAAAATPRRASTSTTKT